MNIQKPLGLANYLKKKMVRTDQFSRKPHIFFPCKVVKVQQERHDDPKKINKGNRKTHLIQYAL